MTTEFDMLSQCRNIAANLEIKLKDIHLTYNIFISNHQMDKSAIENSSDATLEEMGLTKMGDKLSLRGFCKQSSDNETIMKQ